MQAEAVLSRQSENLSSLALGRNGHVDRVAVPNAGHAIGALLDSLGLVHSVVARRTLALLLDALCRELALGTGLEALVVLGVLLVEAGLVALDRHRQLGGVLVLDVEAHVVGLGLVHRH